MISFATGSTCADNANASWLIVMFLSAYLFMFLLYILWSMVGMCTTNARIRLHPISVPSTRLKMKWMDGYANGREKTLSWSEGVANLTVYRTK